MMMVVIIIIIIANLINCRRHQIGVNICRQCEKKLSNKVS